MSDGNPDLSALLALLTAPTAVSPEARLQRNSRQLQELERKLVDLIRYLGSEAALEDRHRLEEERDRLYRELEREREWLEAVLRQLPAGVVIVEAPSARLLLINDQARRLWQRLEGREQEPPAATESSATTPDPAGAIPDWASFPQEWPLQRALRGETLENAELEREMPDGTRLVVRFSTGPVRDRHGDIIAAVLTLTDVSAHREAEVALQAAADRERVIEGERLELARVEMSRRELLHHLVAAQEEERGRIARELHDQLGQYLAALLLGLKGLEAGLPPGRPETHQLHQLIALAVQLDEQIDRLALELRPPALDDLGLTTALKQHLEQWTLHSNIPVDFHSRGLDEPRVPPHVETALYRFIQEALTNVLKHAGARRVSLILERRPAEVCAILEDDGSGFDLEAVRSAPDARRRLGLIGMQERITLAGGTLTIESSLGGGTTLFARIALQPEGGPGGSL